MYGREYAMDTLFLHMSTTIQPVIDRTNVTSLIYSLKIKSLKFSLH